MTLSWVTMVSVPITRSGGFWNKDNKHNIFSVTMVTVHITRSGELWNLNKDNVTFGYYGIWGSIAMTELTSDDMILYYYGNSTYYV